MHASHNSLSSFLHFQPIRAGSGSNHGIAFRKDIWRSNARQSSILPHVFCRFSRWLVHWFWYEAPTIVPCVWLEQKPFQPHIFQEWRSKWLPVSFCNSPLSRNPDQEQSGHLLISSFSASWRLRYIRFLQSSLRSVRISGALFSLFWNVSRGTPLSSS